MSRPDGFFYRGRHPLVLASASPRRVALLKQVGATFTVADPGPDRAWPKGAAAGHGVRALALDKARRIAKDRQDAVVIGVDTIVVARGLRFGKPVDRADAAAMLERLQGRTHDVWSGVAVVRGREQRTSASRTEVRFARMSDAEIRAYVATGEPLDKAGAYGIQGMAAFVREISGDYYNVVGLPLHRLRLMLAELE